MQRAAAEQLDEIGHDSPVGKVLAAASADRDKMRACRVVERRKT